MKTIKLPKPLEPFDKHDPSETVIDTLAIGQYANNGRRVVRLFCDDEQPWCTLSSNLPEEKLDIENAFFLKDYSENAETAAAMIRMGYIVLEPVISDCGFPIARLSDELEFLLKA